MAGAPIALFVFRRPEHARRTIESLLANPGARDAALHVFCDGPRSAEDVAAVAETRRVVRSFALPNARIVEREGNLGLARSVTAGVSEVCAADGSVIVLEDDLVLAPTFLEFMNEALRRYRDEERVYSVSGYAYPVDLPDLGADAVFLPFTASWGWATWQRAWRRLLPADACHNRLRADRRLRARFDAGGYPYFAMLDAARRGKIDSWAIRWYATAFLEEGLTLYPARSLVTNIGFDGSGVHCGTTELAMAGARAEPFRAVRFPAVAVDAEALRRVSRKLGEDRPSLVRGVLARARRIGDALLGRRASQAQP